MTSQLANAVVIIVAVVWVAAIGYGLGWISKVTAHRGGTGGPGGTGGTGGPGGGSGGQGGPGGQGGSGDRPGGRGGTGQPSDAGTTGQDAPKLDLLELDTPTRTGWLGPRQRFFGVIIALLPVIPIALFYQSAAALRETAECAAQQHRVLWAAISAQNAATRALFVIVFDPNATPEVRKQALDNLDRVQSENPLTIVSC